MMSEEGRSSLSRRQQLQRRKTCVRMCTLMTFFILLVLVLSFYVFTRYMNEIVADVERVRLGRNSTCMSAEHAGHEGVPLIITTDPHVAMYAPMLYQVFGDTKTTSEMAQTPARCKRDPYKIERQRYEKTTVIYTPVPHRPLQVHDIAGMTIGLNRTMQTFSDLTSYCLQHMFEFMEESNKCNNLRAHNEL